MLDILYNNILINKESENGKQQCNIVDIRAAWVKEVRWSAKGGADSYTLCPAGN